MINLTYLLFKIILTLRGSVALQSINLYWPLPGCNPNNHSKRIWYIFLLIRTLTVTMLTSVSVYCGGHKKKTHNAVCTLLLSSGIGLGNFLATCHVMLLYQHFIIIQTKEYLHRFSLSDARRSVAGIIAVYSKIRLETYLRHSRLLYIWIIVLLNERS